MESLEDCSHPRSSPYEYITVKAWLDLVRRRQEAGSVASLTAPSKIQGRLQRSLSVRAEEVHHGVRKGPPPTEGWRLAVYQPNLEHAGHRCRSQFRHRELFESTSKVPVDRRLY